LRDWNLAMEIKEGCSQASRATFDLTAGQIFVAVIASKNHREFTAGSVCRENRNRHIYGDVKTSIHISPSPFRGGNMAQ
jgi:hypothetical protein